jgi:hypothetical protein
MMLKGSLISLAVAAVFGMGKPAWALCEANKAIVPATDQYVINGDTVLDKKSGLIWARCSVGQQWQEGKGCTGAVKQVQWVEAMALAHDGWRVPTRDELKTLLSPTCLAPSINEEAFPGTRANLRGMGYWSSTTRGPSLDRYVWVVFFDSGYSAYGNLDSSYLVRLVRDDK